MINIGDGVLRLIADPSGVDREFAQMGRKGAKAGRQASAGLKPMSASLSNIKKLALGVGGVFVGWQVFRVLRDATRAAFEFERTFANVSTLINTQTPKGVKQLKILKQQIFELRPELGSATELTKGLYQALSAGAAPAGAVRLVGEAALFAKAGLTDTLTAVDLMTTVLNAYGKSAEDAAAVSATLFKTIEKGKITGQTLAASLGRVIPAAAALNVSLPELNASLATMTKSGLATAEAVTALRAILKTFTSPEAIKRFEELGISQEKMRDIIAKDGLNAALQELSKRLKGNIAATTNLFREQEAQVGVFTLLGAGADEYKSILDELIVAEKDATATTIAAEKQFAILDARLEAISVTIQKETTVALGKLSPSIDAALDSLEDLGAGSKLLSFVLDTLVNIVAVSIGGWLLFKRSVENAGFQVLRLLAGISGLAEKIPILNKFLGANAALTARFTDIQNNFVESWERSNEEIAKVVKTLIGARGEIEEIAKETPRAAAGIDEVGAAAKRTALSFDELLMGLVRFRGENAALIEQFEQARFKQSLEELNQGLGEIPLNLELAAEGIGVFVEPTEEQLEAMRQKLTETGISFTDLGQQATDAFNQIAGAVQGSGGVMLRILGLIVGQIFRNIVANQALAASTVATEAAKKGAIVKAVKDIALVKSIFEFAEGFAALGRFDFFSAAKHFTAAAFFGAVGALQIAAVAGAFGGSRGGGGAPGAGAEGAAPIRGQVAGDTSGEPLEVERRLAFGGVVTRPTLAMLGERGPEVVVPIGRPGRLGQAAGEELATVIEQHFHIAVEGLISPDNLSDVIQQINDQVKDGDVALQASDSFRVTSKS